MSHPEYLVSARKYRPQRFSELVAQEHIAQALINALKMGRIAHAYLFTGPRGVGKTTSARILAKAINCTGNPEGEVEPCLQCPSCEDFETQRSLSIFEIDAASNNKVDDIRELRENVRIPPQGGRRKVYIVDEVHMLSSAAFNALLKTLEEPPPHILFIFATTEPHKVLPTILSRCQRFDFRRIPTKEIVKHLTLLCERENITADDDALHLIAQKGDGALRDALSIFDQTIALCGSNLSYAVLTNALRVVDVDLYFQATKHIAGRTIGAALRLADHVISDGHDIREFLGGLAEHIRNLLITITLGEKALVDVSKNLQEQYAKAGAHFTESLLLRLLMILDETQTRLPTSTSPRLAMELALAKMTSMTESADLSEVLEQIRRLERAPNPLRTPRHPQQPTTKRIQPVQQPPRGGGGTTIKQQSPPTTPTQNRPPRTQARGGKPALDLGKPKTPAPQDPQNQTSPDFREIWAHVQKNLEQNPHVRGARTLRKSIPITLHNQTLEVAVRNQAVHVVTQNETVRKVVQQALKQLDNKTVTDIKFTARPDLFPNQEPDWAKELEEVPSLKLLHEAFGLRLIHTP